jgi:type I restriction enzyme S subunit
MKQGWKEIELSELVKFQRGFDITKGDQNEGNIPVISSSGINSFHDKAKCFGPGVIIGRKGTLGSVHFSSGPYWPHDTTLWSKEIYGDIRFIYYLLKTLNLGYYDVGNANPTLNRNHIHKLKIQRPPLPAQRKIAAILSAYDNLIENNLKRIKLLEEKAKLTYEEWFVRMKFPRHESTPINEETGLPEGWEKKKIKEIANFQNGYAFYTKGYSDSGFAVIDLANVSEYGDLNITGKEKFISEELYESLPKFHLQKYDIVIAMTDVTSALRILAKSAIIDKSNTYALNQRVGMLRPNTDFFDYSFLYALLSDPRFIDRMKAMSKGAVQFYFNTKDIVNYETFVPKREIIDAFIKGYKPLLESRMKLKNQNQLLKEARDILIPRLMTGMIDVDRLDLSAFEGGDSEGMMMAAEPEATYKLSNN